MMHDDDSYMRASRSYMYIGNVVQVTDASVRYLTAPGDLQV